MNLLSTNIKQLRVSNNYTQEQLANKLGIKRSLLGAIEENRSEPRASTLQGISKIFQTPIDNLLNIDLSNRDSELLNVNKNIDEEGKRIRTHQIVLSEKDLDRELISLVPISARAGYATGVIQPSYIKELPKFNLPLNEIKQFGTYRVFQIAGDSMIPIVKPNDYLICEYVDNWRATKDHSAYIIITHNEGILYKRVTRTNDKLTLISENKDYEPYEIEIGEIIEIWEPVGKITFQLDINTHKDNPQ